MRRKSIFIAFLIMSSLACGLINRVTPVSKPTILPTQAISTQVPSETSATAPAGTQAQATQATSGATKEEPTITPYPTSVLDTQMKNEIDLIQSQVVQERELQPKFQVPVVLLTSNELRTNVVNDFLADYTDEDAADDVYRLSIIGLLDPGFDYRTFYVNVLSEQIAGYYDSDVKEMFVVGDQGFNGAEHLTYAHEFTHVLQDENYGLKTNLKYNDDYCEVNSEYCTAVQAMIEGDATLSEFTWLQNYATDQDKSQVVQFYNTFKSPVLDSAPAFFKDDFVFPYSQGFTFIQYFHDAGGWSAVDAVFKNPPVSSEQILHPSLYPSDTPVPVDLPDMSSALGKNWRQVSSDVMGEWSTYLILKDGIDENARLDDSTAQSAAAGWGGDKFTVFHNDNANTTAFVMKGLWDTANDASEFSVALQKSLNSRFGVKATQQGDTFTWSYSGGYSSLLLSGSTTIWIITPDADTAQIISGLVQP